MRKSNVETQVKIIGIMIIIAGLCLLILNIYFIYCYGTIEDLSVYGLIHGLLLLIAGFGLVKFKSWARKIMLYIMTAHLLFGFIYIFHLIISFILPPTIDYHLLIRFISAMLFMFVFMCVVPAVCTFSLLSRKEIKEFFKRKESIKTQPCELQ